MAKKEKGGSKGNGGVSLNKTAKFMVLDAPGVGRRGTGSDSAFREFGQLMCPRLNLFACRAAVALGPGSSDFGPFILVFAVVCREHITESTGDDQT